MQLIDNFATFILLVIINLWTLAANANHENYDHKRIRQFRCFCKTMSIGDGWWNFGSTVGHVGIQVKTRDGNSYTIHNLGPSGERTTVSTQTDGKDYYSHWFEAPNGYTIGQLRRIADGRNNDGYSFLSNNCYHHRNRILHQFDFNIQNCPNPYEDTTILMLSCSPSCEDVNGYCVQQYSKSFYNCLNKPGKQMKVLRGCNNNQKKYHYLCCYDDPRTRK